MPWNHAQSVKEVIRHLLFKTGTQSILNTYRQKRGFVTAHLDGANTANRFEQVYKLGVWVHEDGQKSRSGRGSESSSTERMAAQLPDILSELGCSKLVDVGCGDWNWMSHIELPCEYLGMDIVPEVIQENKRHEKPGVSFSVGNAIEEEIPDADVALCREVLFHLSFADGKAVLSNIIRNAKWLITTTDTAIWFNSDIVSGDYRRLNLQAAPYRLPPPFKLIPDDALTPGRALAVWKTSELSV